MVPFLAFSLQDQVEKYGAYVGIAAFFGLAVLTILYFAQARELRRLRDWAGRAPERAQEIEARAVAQAQAARRVQSQPQHTPAPAPAAPGTAAATAAAQPAQGEQATEIVEPDEGATQAGNGTAAAASEAGEGEEEPEGASGGGNGDKPGGGAKAAGAAAAGVAAEEQEGEAEQPEGDEAEADVEAAKPAAAAAAAAATDDKAADGEARKDADDGDEAPPEIPVAPVPRATPLPRRAPAPAAPLRQPSRSTTLPPRRPAPAARGPAPAGSSGRSSKLVPALVGGGVLVLAVAALLVTGVIGGGEDAPPAPNTTSDATPDSTSAPGEEPLTPAATKVAVLNGTTIPGLASREKDTLTDAGFSEIATGNNTDQQRADSSVLYGTRTGARAQANAVARRLDIAKVERLDADTRDLSEGADVVVILGQD